MYEPGEPHPSWIDPIEVLIAACDPDVQARQEALAARLASGERFVEAFAAVFGASAESCQAVRVLRPALVPLQWCAGPEPGRVRCWSPQFDIEVDEIGDHAAARAMAAALSSAARLVLTEGDAGDLTFDAVAILQASCRGLDALAEALVAETEVVEAG